MDNIRVLNNGVETNSEFFKSVLFCVKDAEAR